MRIHVLTSRWMINPDEAVLMAWAKRGEFSLVPFKGVVTNTSGPGWPLALGLIHQLGLPATLITAHVLSFLFAYLAIIFILESCSNYVSRGRSLLILTLPTFLVASAGGNAGWGVDLFSLTTESLPLLLISMSFWIYIRTDRHLLASLILGIAIITKYQVALLALALVLIFSITQKVNGEFRTKTAVRMFISIGCLILPFFAICMWSILAGVPIRNIRESIWAPISYAGSGRISSDVNIFDRIQIAFTTIIGEPLMLIGFLISLALILLLTDQTHRAKLKRSQIQIMLLAVACLTTLSVTTPIFAHYYQIPLFAGLFAIALVLRNFSDSPNLRQVIEDTSPRKSIVFCVAVFVGLSWPHVSQLSDSMTALTAFKNTDKAVLEPEVSQQAMTLFQFCPRGSQVFVWGWAAELYSYYDWMPATSFVESSMAMNSNFESIAAKDIIRDDLVYEQPRCIVEALGPQFFGNFDSINDAIVEHIPNVRKFLRSRYERIVVEDVSLPGLVVYVREET